MNLKEVFRDYFNELKDEYGENASSGILDLLFEHLGFPKGYRLLNPEIKIDRNQLEKLEEFKSELYKYKPVQYILGYAWFMDMKFIVNSSVLIPRQETEELVHLICKENKEKLLKVKVLDIGTGSGCIAISLSRKMKNAEVSGNDISEEALHIANVNAEKLKANVHFFYDDILNPEDTKYPAGFDIIVSNPPYVTLSEKKYLAPNVLHYEPGTALFVPDKDPLKFYRKILSFASEKLISKGKVYLEINEKYGQEIKDLFEKNNFEKIRIIQDIHGKNRIATGIK